MQQVNKWMVLVIVGLALGLMTGAGDEGVKIGVVDVEQALNSTDEGKAAREELSRKQREARTQVEPLMERFENLKEEIKGKKYVLSEEALFQKQVELAELQNKIEARIKELEGELKIENGKMLAPLEAKMQSIIDSIGKDQGFTLILTRENPVLMYSREALDITDLVVSQFNKKS